MTTSVKVGFGLAVGGIVATGADSDARAAFLSWAMLFLDPKLCTAPASTSADAFVPSFRIPDALEPSSPTLRVPCVASVAMPTSAPPLANDLAPVSESAFDDDEACDLALAALR
jgi:hypothetical protein